MKRRPILPNYGSIVIGDNAYYRTRVADSDGKRVSLYAKTREELFNKYNEAVTQIDNQTFRKQTPTVKEYAEKWLLMQSVHVRKTTLIDYTSKVKRHIIAPLGDMRMGDVTADDIKMALIPVAKKSASVYKSVIVLYKCIFSAAKESHIILKDPTTYLKTDGGGIPQKEKIPLTDEQVEILLDAAKGNKVYVFIMLGLYAGLRREEILGLQWDSVFLDVSAPYLIVQRAWHPENNRPVIMDELKTNAAHREIPIPERLLECLKEAKEKSISDYVIANNEGKPLSQSQFRQMWKYVEVRSTKERFYFKKENGKRVMHVINPVLGEYAPHTGKRVQYTIDFDVTPHLLRHTYITNLIAASVDPKTVQYLAGHESSKITMDIYAKVKYNKPEDLLPVLEDVFSQWGE